MPRAFWFGLIALALHFALARLTPLTTAFDLRFFGLNHARYLSLPASIALYLAAAAVLAVVLRPRAPRVEPPREGPLVRWEPWLWVVGAFIVCLLFRSMYAFLGDNFLRVQEALLGKSSPNEVGAMSTLHWLTRVAGATDLRGGQAVFVGVSYLAGVIFWAALTGLCFLLARRASRPRSDVRWMLGGLAGSGIIALFCGYVEVYPLVLAVLALAVFAAVAAELGAVPRFVPVLVLAVAVLLHRVSLLWVPMALYPMLSSSGLHRRLDGRTILGATLLLGILAAIGLQGRTPVLLPLVAADRGYSLFSMAHLSDFWNSQALGSLPGMLLAPIAVWMLFRRDPTPFSACGSLALGAIPPSLALFLFRPTLGGSDWDLLALATPFALVFAAWWAVSAAENWARPMLKVAVVLGCVNTLPWLAVQSGEISIQRTRDLVTTDRAPYFTKNPPPMHLSALFGSNGRTDLQREALLDGRRTYPDDPRYAVGLARLARSEKDWSSAERWALEAYQQDRMLLPALDVLYDAFGATGKTEEQFLAGMAILEAAEREHAVVEGYLSGGRLAEIRATCAAYHAAHPDGPPEATR